MNELIRSLIESLTEEAGHYRQLAVLADRQRELLVAGKVEALPENLRLEEKEVFALGPLVAGRNGILDKMAKMHQLKKMGLGEALEKCPPDQAADLRKAVTELVTTAKKLEEINRINETLLGNALSEVNFTLRLIQSGGKVKSPLAPATAEEKKPSFVNRVI